MSYCQLFPLFMANWDKIGKNAILKFSNKAALKVYQHQQDLTDSLNR
jgi:hypothetical protein